MLEGTVEQIIDSTPMLGTAATQDTVRVIRHGVKKLIDAVMAVDQDGVPGLQRGTRQGRIISTVDPEMRHGRKSSQQRSDGYKLSAAATNSIEPLIIAVNVCPASETDGPQAKHLIDGEPQSTSPSGSWATLPMATDRSAPSSPSALNALRPSLPYTALGRQATRTGRAIPQPLDSRMRRDRSPAGENEW
jgi:hypothetical protein